ncbi:hypothetical protein DUI87_01759 [Hirundo rustica rustica]|uniref:Uncharacterized protein n=1 Tax=Hirundo rustica rustica TaxID=333673 RepID=A0A3M0L7E8_HIRRU|nr:hypothetical protein DUI87_01759 [Hirundo rustica rustica]
MDWGFEEPEAVLGHRATCGKSSFCRNLLPGKKAAALEHPQGLLPGDGLTTPGFPGSTEGVRRSNRDRNRVYQGRRLIGGAPPRQNQKSYLAGGSESRHQIVIDYEHEEKFQ